MDIKVSIIIPVYNKAEYLADCLDSVLGQSFRAPWKSFALMMPLKTSAERYCEITQIATPVEGHV